MLVNLVGGLVPVEIGEGMLVGGGSLDSTGIVETPYEPDWVRAVCHLYVIRVSEQEYTTLFLSTYNSPWCLQSLRNHALFIRSLPLSTHDTRDGD